MKWYFLNRSRYGLWVLMLASVFALNGCYHPQTAKTTETDSVALKWQVSLTINGGITGQSRSIAIDHQGVAQFTDHTNKNQINSEISVTDLKKLEKLVKIYSSAPPTKTARSPACRDCFSYAINAKYGGKVKRQQMSDLNMDNNAQRLIGALKNLSPEHTQQTK